MKVSSSTTKF
jgi:TLD